MEPSISLLGLRSLSSDTSESSNFAQRTGFLANTSSSFVPKSGKTLLNPNAREYVPIASSSGSSVNYQGSVTISKPTIAGDPGDELPAQSGRLNSFNSNASDDENQRYWHAQLPDDLLDSGFYDDLFYDVAEKNDSYFSGLDRAYSYPFSTGGGVVKSPFENSLHIAGADLGKQQHLQYELAETDAMEVLLAKFPGFAIESLADVFYANDCDLALTVEMLQQLELQEERVADLFDSPVSSSPVTLMDFPALGIDILQESTSPQSAFSAGLNASLAFRGNAEFSAVVRKESAQQRQFVESGGTTESLGSSRSLLQWSRNMNGVQEGRLRQSAVQPWLDTGDAVANVYADVRGDAQDHARVRNMCFEQARQAYLAGNKKLAKELSIKGQWHNDQMKAAHDLASEAIFRERNGSITFGQTKSRVQGSLVDLHGLHVTEALSVLKRELAALRSSLTGRSQPKQVFVCVGTGHHSKGVRGVARLPPAVKQYLLEKEHLQFIETQPGMLQIFLQ